MANICDTTYRITGGRDSLNDMEARIKKATKDSAWLGEIVKEYGGDPNAVHCRGELTYMEWGDPNAVLVLCCNTAWGEMPEFRHFLERQYGDICIFYTAVEPGCGVFCTNDDNFANLWHVDASRLDYGDFLTGDELVRQVREAYRAEVNDIKDVLSFARWFNDQHPDGDEWINFNQMEITED